VRSARVLRNDLTLLLTSCSPDGMANTTKFRTTVLLIVTTMWCGGCSTFRVIEEAGTTPVPFDKALKGVEQDVRDAQPIILSSIGNSGGSAALEASLESIQCAANLADPIIPVFTGPVQLTLQGTISEAGAFAISATPSLTTTVTRQAQQQVMVPMTWVSMATLADFYLSQELAYLQYATLLSVVPDAATFTDSAGASVIYKADVTTAVEHLIATRHEIAIVVAHRLKNQPTKARCDLLPKPTGVTVAVPRPGAH
jgi:hypothetical protein